MRSLLRFFPSLLLAACCLSFVPPHSTDKRLILGTWVSEQDKKWKLVFTPTTCTQYYSGKTTSAERYAFSNTTPQCGEKVPVEKYTSYLQLTDMQNHEATCYEVNGLTATTLSLRPIHNGGAMVFVKSKL
jgi:hypothetical protein